MSTLPTSILLSTSSPNQTSQKKEIKAIQIGNEGIKLSFFTDDIILYVENPKYSTKKKKPLLEQINELNKLSGYKIYTQKFILLL